MIFNVEEETENLAWWDQAGCHMPCVKTREEFANRSKTCLSRARDCVQLEALNLDFFSCRISCLLVLSRAITWQIMAKLWVWTAGCK